MTLTTSAKVVFIHWKYFWRYSFYLWWTSLALFTVSIEWVDIWYYFNLCKLIDLFDTINFYTSTPMKRLRMINPSTEYASVLYDAKSINDETRNICRVKSQFLCCIFVRRYKPRKVCIYRENEGYTYNMQGEREKYITKYLSWRLTAKPLVLNRRRRRRHRHRHRHDQTFFFFSSFSSFVFSSLWHIYYRFAANKMLKGNGELS